MRRPLALFLLALAGTTAAEEIELEAALVEVPRGEITATAAGRSGLERLILLQRELLAQLLYTAGIQSPEAELLTRRPPPKISSLRELEILGEALEEIDRGHFPRARTLLQELSHLQLDLVQQLLQILPEEDLSQLPPAQLSAKLARTSSRQARALARVLAEGEGRAFFAEAIWHLLERPKEELWRRWVPALLARNQFSTGDQAQIGQVYGPASELAREERRGRPQPEPEPQPPGPSPQPQPQPEPTWGPFRWQYFSLVRFVPPGATPHPLPAWGIEEGHLPEPDALGDLAQQNARYTYREMEVADFLHADGQVDTCLTADCGSFEAVLDFGRMDLENFRLTVQAPTPRQPILHIEADGIPVHPDGSFGFSEGVMAIGTSGDPEPARQGSVEGRVYGPAAEEMGGLFELHGEGIFARGGFGGRR